jgi:hypothetical protein
MARIAIRSEWVGVLDFATRFPRGIVRGMQAGLVASPAETDAGNRAKLEAAVAGSVPTDRPATTMSGTPRAERRQVLRHGDGHLWCCIHGRSGWWVISHSPLQPSSRSPDRRKLVFVAGQPYAGGGDS